MVTVDNASKQIPYISSGTRREHLEALFKDLKNHDEMTWKPFNSFDDVDDAHIGKLLHALNNKSISYAKPKDSRTKQIMKVVGIVFIALLCLALITVGALAFAAALPLSIALASVALAAGLVGLSVLIAVTVKHYKALKDVQNSHLTGVLKQYPLVQDPAYANLCRLSDSFLFDKNQKIAASEYLAHDVAYEELSVGQIIPIREQVGNVTYAKVNRSINNEGFVCFLLTPLQEKKHLKNFPIWEIYRGTHDKKSMKRLGEAFSAGHSSYKLYEQTLLDAKRAIVPINVQSIVEKKIGHSLGGADAKRSAKTTAVKIANMLASTTNFSGTNPYLVLNEKDYLNKIRAIELYTWNSAGIAHETNDQLKEAIIKIHDAQKNGKWLGCDFIFCICKVAGDAIQRTGQITLGHGIAVHYSNVTREVYKFHHGFEGFTGFIKHWGMSTARAHTVRNLNRQINGSKDPSHTYLNSKIDYTAIEADNSDHITIGGNAWETIKSLMSAKLIGKSPGL